MAHPEIPQFLQMPTSQLMDEFGAGRHKPGSGSAAALLGLVACKMMQTVITVTRRNASYAANIPQLDFVGSALLNKNEPFFRDAVQRDSELSAVTQSAPPDGHLLGFKAHHLRM